MRTMLALGLAVMLSMIAFGQSTPYLQYPSIVLAKSSEFSSTNYSATRALGRPNVFPSCGSSPQAWASSTPDGAREFLVLGINVPSQASRVRIYQTSNPGAVDTVYLREAGTNTLHTIYTATASPVACATQSVLEINFPLTAYRVNGIRIAINSAAVIGTNEIDAVEILTDLPANVKVAENTGNWSNASTWLGGNLPGSADTVVVAEGTTSTIDADFSFKALIVDLSSTLVMNSNQAVTLGPVGGGKEFMTVYGTLNLSNGTLTVNGNVDFQPGSSIIMSGGNFVVDANDGTAAGSVRNGVELLVFQAGMSTFNISNGMITIVDPQFNSLGQAISSPPSGYNMGVNSTLRFGDGVSTDPSSNTFGFGNNPLSANGQRYVPGIGNFILDAGTGTNRLWKYDQGPINVMIRGNCTINSGTMYGRTTTYIVGNLLNNASVLNSGNTSVQGNLVNNGQIIPTLPDQVIYNFIVYGDFTNNSSAVYSNLVHDATYIGGNLLNNGQFEASELWFHNDPPNGFPARPQTLSGSGTFSIISLVINNLHSSGVTLDVPLTIDELSFYFAGSGKLYIGNNDLTVRQKSTFPTNPNLYVVLNGTGRFIGTIGSSTGAGQFAYNVGFADRSAAVLISNAAGHTFTVQPTATSIPGAVNIQWDITDLSPGPLSATVSTVWHQSYESAGFNRGACYLSHFTGGHWHVLSGAGAAVALANGYYSRTATGVTSFSPFGVGSNGALPVKLKSFTAAKQNDVVQLKWITTEEINLKEYVVERSNDGNSFTKLKQLPARGLSSEQLYTTVDETPGKGVNYYRLNQVDMDGKFAYSKIVKVDMRSAFTIFIYPNPTRNQIHVQGFQKLRSIELIDMSGRLKKKWEMPLSEELYVGNILPGVYQLRLISDDQIFTERLIIEN